MRNARRPSASRAAVPCARASCAEITSCIFAVRNKHVTESPYGLDIGGLGGIGLDQFAQTRNLQVERAELASAREFHQLVAREWRARVLHEHLEESEFTGRQRQLFAVARETAR